MEVDVPGKDDGSNAKEDAGEEVGMQGLRGPFVATEEEVNEAFDQIKAVRYSQPIHLSGESTHGFDWRYRSSSYT